MRTDAAPFLEENSTMSDSTIFVVEVVLAIVAVPAIAALIIFFMRRRDRLLRSR